MTISYFLSLERENQLQVIRSGGTLHHRRKDYNFDYELYEIHDFYVEVCKCSTSFELQSIRCFNNKNEVNRFVAKVGIESILA